MNARFPTHYEEVRLWAIEESISITESGRRYAQYLILRAIGQSNSLRQSLVFKGGNALEFVYQPNRSTTDLDFSFLDRESRVADLMPRMRRLFQSSLNAINDGSGTTLRLQSLVQNPPGSHMTHPTLVAKVAYALPDQSRQRERLVSGQPGANVIPVEMSVNEVVCQWQSIPFGQGQNEIRVATLEDIVAEKLRAILQQTVRNRHRSQDILDIAVLRSNPNISLDTTLVGEFLLLKCTARNIEPTRSSFTFPDIQSRGASQYVALQNTVRHTFIPFEEAWEFVLQLVNALDIPD